MILPFSSLPFKTMQSLLFALLLILVPQQAESFFNLPKALDKCSDPLGCCYDMVNIVDPNVRQAVPCPLVKESLKLLEEAKARIEAIASSAGKQRTRSADGDTQSPTQALNVTFNCIVKDTSLCRKAQAAFGMASRIIANILALDAPLQVNATFASYCTAYGKCSTGKNADLGGASPTRVMLHTDKDGMQRMYPQALYKQLHSQSHPEWASTDITATFNADIDWWFIDDSKAIRSNQFDFLLVITHELIHGLGFLTSWTDYMNDPSQALTPAPMRPDVMDDPSANAYIFSGFFETVFDSHIVQIPSLKPLSNITRTLNEFNGPGTINTTFPSQQAFIQRLQLSPSYDEARKIMSLATTPNTLGFMPTGGTSLSDVIVLETSLSWSQGSSISHVDDSTYNPSQDFLMRYKEDPGTTLWDDITHSGKYPGGAIGPKLTIILETLGYTVNKNPVLLSLSSSSSSLEDDQSSSSSSASASSSSLFIPWTLFLALFCTLSTTLV